MSERSSDSNWLPQPPPKPLKATSAPLLFLGALTVVAVGVIVWTSAAGRSEHKVKPDAAPSTVSAAPQSAREAFDQCMHNMGAGSSGRVRGRFGGGGPSKSFRNAFAVCRSLLRPGRPDPVAPPRTGTTPAPIA